VVDHRGNAPLILSLCTFIAGSLPFAVYYAERVLGFIGTEAEYLELGYNHGPWRWEAEGFTLLWPLLLLMVITVVWGVIRAMTSHRIWPLLFALALFISQSGLMFLHLWTLGWLID